MYDFDRTGTNPNNRVYDEPFTVSGVNGVNNYYFIPEFAPFSEVNTIITNQTGDVLKPGVDYVFGHKYESASGDLDVDFYGSIVFTDPTRSGSYKLNYGTIGDDYLIDEEALARQGLGAIEDFQTVRLEDLVDVPTEFPPSPHNVATTDIEGINEILASMERLHQSLLTERRELNMNDITDLETGFIQPLITAISGISASIYNAIDAISLQRAYYDTSIAADASVVGSPVNGIWYDTDVSVTIPKTGEYLVLNQVTGKVDWVNAPGKISMKPVVNGNDMALQGKNKSFVRSFTQGDVLSVKLQVSNGQANNLRIRDSEFESTFVVICLTVAS